MANQRKKAGNPAKEILRQDVAANQEKVTSVPEVADPKMTEEQVVPVVVEKPEVPEKETVEEPAEETVEEPVEETAEETAEETVEEPAEETVEEPAEETVEESAEETVEEPAEETVEETAEETVEETAEETAEKPAEESEVPVKVAEASKDDGFKKAVVAGGLIGLVLLLSTFIVLLCLLLRGNQPPVENPEETTVSTSESTQKTEDTSSSTSESTQKTEDTSSSTSESTQKTEDTSSSTSESTQKPEEPEKPAFDVKAFEKKATKLAESFGNTNAAADVAKLTAQFGTENLASLVEEYGEAKVAKELAALVTFAPNSMGMAYADEIGSNWISTEDFFEEQLEKSDEYQAVTGKNPETVLMTLVDPDNPEFNYETFKGNVSALLALAKKTMSENEYTLFEEWLTMRNSGFALANKVEKHVTSQKQVLLISEGTLEFFELQMKMVEGGMVTTTAGNQASAEYVEFVQTNFYIITAGA